MTLKIGIVGLGAIGNYLADRINEDLNFEIIAVNDIDENQYGKFCERFGSTPPLLPVERFPDNVDVFIECASANAVKAVVGEAVRRQKAVIIASIGGVALDVELLDLVHKSKAKVILPSGAIGGLDILKALDKSEISEITLTTRKNPDSLPKTMGTIEAETEIYCGNASEAIKRFPKNINVAALLSLAGIGLERTKVRIIADPDIDLNTHEISIISTCGRYRITCENQPFPENMASSMLAAKSLFAALKSLKENLTIGL
jgi:aspartate dehydrogenase